MNYSLTDEESYILRSFTQFEARIYEQALLTYYRPLLNISSTIVFQFMNWKPGYVEGFSKGVPVTVTSEDTGEVYTFTSILQTANFLRVSPSTIRRYLNVINSPVLSPILGYRYVVDQDRPIKDHIEYQSDANCSDPIKGIDIDSLEPGKLYAYRVDKVTLFGTYKTPGEAAKVLDNKSENKYIRRYINLDSIVLVGPDQTPVYFVMNPTYKDDMTKRAANRSVIVQSPKYLLEDTMLGTTTQYRTYKDILSHTGSTATPESIKRYVNSGKMIHNRYLITKISR